MAEKQIVSHYGIHYSRGIGYLMQGRGSTNALGLRDAPPFQVITPSRTVHCNHQIYLSAMLPPDQHWNFFLQLIEDPLVKALLPIPKRGSAGTYFIVDNEGELLEYLVMLAKMSSPINSIVVPIWTLTVQSIVKELQMTNVQPFILTQIEAQHSTMLSQIAKAAVHLPRTILLVGKSDVVVPPGAIKIKTELNSGKYDKMDLMTLPWETLGGIVVKREMRHEWPPETNPRGSDEDTVPTARVGRHSQR